MSSVFRLDSVKRFSLRWLQKYCKNVKLQNNSEKICIVILYFQEFEVTLQLNQNDQQKKSFEFNIH